MTTLSIRIEEKLKKDANKTFSALGIDMSSAVKMFLNQVVIEQGLPFKPSRTLKQIREEWDRETAHALKYGKRYDNVDDMFKDILHK